METHHHLLHEGFHIGLDITKLAFKAAGLVAAFLMVKELHKVHKSLEERHKLSK